MKFKVSFFPRLSREIRVAIFICLGAVASLLLTMMGQDSWGGAVRILCGFYTIATGLFFLAQLYGFVICQTQYSDAVEAPKFTMLENEEEEWKR